MFDFGYDDTHCVYLTPAEKNKMRLVLRQGSIEKTIEAPKLVSTWRHIAITFSADAVCIYQNGELVAESVFEGQRIMGPLNYLGRSQRGDVPGFKGYFDDFCIYNYALNASAISSLANELHEDVNLDGIVDTQDVLAIYQYIQNTSLEGGGKPDVNLDGIVDTQDILRIYEYINQH